MVTIILTKEHYVKSGTRWHLVETEEPRTIDRREFNNITDEKTLSWFRRLGGCEIAERRYTAAGYVPVKLHSIAPDRTEKFVYNFTIKG